MNSRIHNLLLIILLSCHSIIKAQVTTENFDKEFTQAKQFLYDFMPEKALPVLIGLYEEQPKNHNLEYLIGACYTDTDPESGKATFYLEKARPYVDENYDADNPSEKKASIHLHYFLAVAYAQTGRCEDAEKENEKFHSHIGKIGQAYLRDAQFWVDACHKLRAEPKPPVTADTDLPPSPPSEGLIENSKIVTQLVEYNTPTPLYGVQVGSFSKFMPTKSFDDIKNVEAFIDKGDKVRYVVGNFTFRNQAETLLKVLQESGYSDAFIVDVNKERKFTKRIITVNDISIKSTIVGKVHFRCQIGAFRDTIPEEMARKYLKISGIKENIQDKMTLLSVGHFGTYEEAKAFIDELRAVEIYDAFVVAYNYDQKIPVKEAISYLKSQPNNRERKGKRK